MRSGLNAGIDVEELALRANCGVFHQTRRGIEWEVIEQTPLRHGG